MNAHHTVMISGSDVYELRGSLDDARARLGRLLAGMDGEEDYSLVLGALPPGKGVDDVDLRTWPHEYIQSAGSHDAMTVEVREITDDRPHQYVVGRSPNQPPGPPDVEIPWDEFVVTVYEDEVFDADEAAEIFGHYLEHGSVPASHALREIDLDAQE